MFNPLLSLQMAWADDKLTNSFWYVIHDLFSVSGNTFFLKEKTKPQKHSITRKKKKPVCFSSHYCKIIQNPKRSALPLRLVCLIATPTLCGMYGNSCAGPEHLSDLRKKQQQDSACLVLPSKDPQAAEQHYVCAPNGYVGKWNCPTNS